MKPTRRSTDNLPDLAQARARYEATRTVLFALLVAVALGFLAMLLLLGYDLRKQQDQLAQLAEENKREAQVVAELLARQQESDRNRQRIINEAVAAIAAEQRRALVAHDHSVKDYLEKALGLLDREVNSPSNKERPAMVLPLPPGPFVGPRAVPTVQPQPQPTAAPAPKPPPPCEKRGNSGKCRKK